VNAVVVAAAGHVVVGLALHDHRPFHIHTAWILPSKINAPHDQGMQPMSATSPLPPSTKWRSWGAWCQQHPLEIHN
jgi:hypothetical protein